LFISDELVFVELHKTGCTHIGKLLASLVKGVQRGKHNAPPPALLTSGRKFLGSVRNPWDWYVSLWAYGCDHKGLVYNYTTQPLQANEKSAALPAVFLNAPGTQNNLAVRKPEKWKRCYSDSKSASAFQDWLHMMNDKDYWNDFGEGYGVNPIARFAGLLSYRYINLFCRHSPAQITSIKDLISYEKTNCFINYFIRTEHLEDDFVTALESCGIHISKSQASTIYSAEKTNTSSRRNETAYFYDNETLKLVSEREQIIIDKFSYLAPSI